jgi:hypothetical protein
MSVSLPRSSSTYGLSETVVFAHSESSSLKFPSVTNDATWLPSVDDWEAGLPSDKSQRCGSAKNTNWVSLQDYITIVCDWSSGQTRKHCFLAMFPKGGQTRKHCFIAMYVSQRWTNQDTLFHSHVSQRRTNQETLFPCKPCFPKVDKTMQETLFPSHVSQIDWFVPVTWL